VPYPLYNILDLSLGAQSVRLGSNEVACDDGRRRPKRVRKIVNMRLSHLKEII
jgi:hypothetical protein